MTDAAPPTSRPPLMPPITPALAVLSEAPIARCVLARDRLKAARFRLGTAVASHSRADIVGNTGEISVLFREPNGRGMETGDSIFSHIQMDDGATRIIVHPTRNPAIVGRSDGCIITLDPHHLDRAEHPLSPHRYDSYVDEPGRPKKGALHGNVRYDHAGIAAQAMDRMIALLDVACDPARRLAHDDMITLRDRLAAVSATLHMELLERVEATSVQAFAPNFDTALRAIANGSKTLPVGSRDIIDPALVAGWSTGLVPTLAVADRTESFTAMQNGEEVTLTGKPDLTLRAASFVHSSGLSIIETLRTMAKLPRGAIG